MCYMRRASRRGCMLLWENSASFHVYLYLETAMYMRRTKNLRAFCCCLQRVKTQGRFAFNFFSDFILCTRFFRHPGNRSKTTQFGLFMPRMTPPHHQYWEVVDTTCVRLDSGGGWVTVLVANRMILFGFAVYLLHYICTSIQCFFYLSKTCPKQVGNWTGQVK